MVGPPHHLSDLFLVSGYFLFEQQFALLEPPDLDVVVRRSSGQEQTLVLGYVDVIGKIFGHPLVYGGGREPRLPGQPVY